MIIVVEITSRAGTHAYKEYDSPSLDAAIEAASRELRAYPTFRVTNVRIKDDRSFEWGREEEW